LHGSECKSALSKQGAFGSAPFGHAIVGPSTNNFLNQALLFNSRKMGPVSHGQIAGQANLFDLSIYGYGPFLRLL
jgi:hypothetical protein